MVDFARVQKELMECSRDREQSGIRVVPRNNGDLGHLVGSIPGPFNSPYEGGTFQIDISLPDAYQSEPPKMHFTSKVCNCRDYQTFVSTARYWTESFPKSSSTDEKVIRLVAMGFPECRARSVLETVGGDENFVGMDFTIES